MQPYVCKIIIMIWPRAWPSLARDHRAGRGAYIANRTDRARVQRESQARSRVQLLGNGI